MPVTVRATDILFNNGTTQSTAAAAVDTTNVLNATAGASTGGVGTYAFLATSYAGITTPGNSVAGSNLRYVGTYPSANSGTPSGTWRVMGRAETVTSSTEYGTTYTYYGSLWLRIS